MKSKKGGIMESELIDIVKILAFFAVVAIILIVIFGARIKQWVLHLFNLF